MRELLGRPLGDDLAAEQDDHPVADELDLAEQVRVEEDGDAAGAHLLEQLADGAAADGIERARRLVEQQDLRTADERLRDSEPLLHALRHLLDTAVARLGEGDELEQPRTLVAPARGAGKPLVEAEQLLRGHPARKTEELGQVPEARSRLPGAGARPADERRAARRPDEPARDLHQRRLAGAVRPEQSHQLAFGHLEIDTVERLHPPVALGQGLDSERGGHTASVGTVPRWG